MNRLSLSANDKKILLNWFESFLTNSQHFGTSSTVFPEEQYIQRILQNDDVSEIDLTDNQVEIIYSWIDATIHEKYGNAKYLFSDEKKTYIKIVSLQKEILNNEKVKKELDDKIKKVSNKIGEPAAMNEKRKNRSFEEKLKAVNKICNELNKNKNSS